MEPVGNVTDDNSNPDSNPNFIPMEVEGAANGTDDNSNFESGPTQLLEVELVADVASMESLTEGIPFDEGRGARYLFQRPSTEGPFVSRTLGVKRSLHKALGNDGDPKCCGSNKHPCTTGLRKEADIGTKYDLNSRPPWDLPDMGGDDIRPDPVPSEFKLSAVGGLDEQISYLKRSIILPLVRPEVFKNWGMSPPKGILLHGPPGTGKTYVAKAIVNELKAHLGSHVNFYYRKGGDVFSMWFGESQKKLRQVFHIAKLNQPSVIFFDEIDGLCPSREKSSSHGTDAYNGVVTCFLGQMDGLENGKVFVIAATNRLEAVDPAVRRPGRFDKHLGFNFPDEEARQKIIRIHTSHWGKNDKPSDELVRLIAKKSMGFTGADLEKLCKDAVHVLAMEEESENKPLTRDHWVQALNSMQRTASDTFGSNILVPSPPSEIVSQLIKSNVDQVVSQIAPMLSPAVMNLETLTASRSFLLSITPMQSRKFLNAHLLQGILSHISFRKCIIFEVNASTLLNKVMNLQKPSLFTGILDVINQAKEAADEGKSAIVVVSNLDELYGIWKTNNLPPPMLVYALAKVKGPRVMLLATSSKPLENFEEPIFNSLFQSRTIPLENPGYEDLRVFFGSLATEASNEDLSQVFQEMNDKIADAAVNRNHFDILDLYAKLKELQEEKDAEIEDDEDQVADTLIPEIKEEIEEILLDFTRSHIR